MSAVIDLHHNGKFSVMADLHTMRRYQRQIKEIDNLFFRSQAWNNSTEVKEQARQEAVKLRDAFLDVLEKHGEYFSFNVVPSQYNPDWLNHWFTIYSMATLIGHSFEVSCNWFD